MAGRALWILAGGAALIGGIIYREGVNISWDDEDGSPIVIDSKGHRDDHIDPATAKALAAAIARQVRAEVRLETMDAVGDPSKEELEAAKEEVARAEAEVDRLEAAIEEQRDHAERDVAREEKRGEAGKETR